MDEIERSQVVATQLGLNGGAWIVTAAEGTLLQSVLERVRQVLLTIYAAGLEGFSLIGTPYLGGLANLGAPLEEAILGGNFALYEQQAAPESLGSVDCGAGGFLTGVSYGQIGAIDDTVCFGCGEFTFSGEDERNGAACRHPMEGRLRICSRVLVRRCQQCGGGGRTGCLRTGASPEQR